MCVGRWLCLCFKLYYQQLSLQCFKNCIEVSDCHTHTGLFKPELPLHTGIRIKIAMKLKTHSQKEIAPGEARTHGLQIMRLTRCLLRYGGFLLINFSFTLLWPWKQKNVLKIDCVGRESNPGQLLGRQLC